MSMLQVINCYFIYNSHKLHDYTTALQMNAENQTFNAYGVHFFNVFFLYCSFSGGANSDKIPSLFSCVRARNNQAPSRPAQFGQKFRFRAKSIWVKAETRQVQDK